MPGKILLDTNFIIAFFSDEKAVTQHVRRVEQRIPAGCRTLRF
jgi:hypothetical protein